jgi:hypothetical protein
MTQPVKTLPGRAKQAGNLWESKWGTKATVLIETASGDMNIRKKPDSEQGRAVLTIQSGQAVTLVCDRQYEGNDVWEVDAGALLHEAASRPQQAAPVAAQQPQPMNPGQQSAAFYAPPAAPQAAPLPDQITQTFGPPVGQFAPPVGQVQPPAVQAFGIPPLASSPPAYQAQALEEAAYVQRECGIYSLIWAGLGNLTDDDRARAAATATIYIQLKKARI